MSQTDYLNAMGISTWVLQDAEEPTEIPVANIPAENMTATEPSSMPISQPKTPDLQMPPPKQRQSSP